MPDKLAVTEKDITAFFDSTLNTTEFQDKQLGRVATLANQIVAYDKEIADDEKDLKVLKEQRRQLAEDMLPALMTEHGLTEITLNDGSKVSVKNSIVVLSLLIKPLLPLNGSEIMGMMG